jgi:hypothetical protein
MKGVFNGLLEKKPEKLNSYFQTNCNYSSILERFTEFNQRLESDKDRVRVEGACNFSVYFIIFL